MKCFFARGDSQAAGRAFAASAFARIRAAKQAAQTAGAPLFVLDGAVIVGEAFEQYCDAIIVVTAPEREAVSRIVLRDGISKQAARMRLAAQTPEDVLRAAADYIIANTGDGRHLRAAAQAVLERLLAKETNGTKEKT